jgi:hypothetical protein
MNLMIQASFNYLATRKYWNIRRHVLERVYIVQTANCFDDKDGSVRPTTLHSDEEWQTWLEVRFYQAEISQLKLILFFPQRRICRAQIVTRRHWC